MALPLGKEVIVPNDPLTQTEQGILNALTQNHYFETNLQGDDLRLLLCLLTKAVVPFIQVLNQELTVPASPKIKLNWPKPDILSIHSLIPVSSTLAKAEVSVSYEYINKDSDPYKKKTELALTDNFTLSILSSNLGWFAKKYLESTLPERVRELLADPDELIEATLPQRLSPYSTIGSWNIESNLHLTKQRLRVGLLRKSA